MTVRQSNSFVRLSAHVRRGVVAMTIVLGSATGAMATPLTLTHSFGSGETPIPTFDTNVGALTGIFIQLNYVWTVATFRTPDRINDLCSATLTGENVSVSAPGTPVLLSSSLSRTTEFQPCDSFSIQFLQMAGAEVAPSYFDAFTSVGPSSLSMIVTRVLDSATMTAYDPDETRQTSAAWEGWGTVAYTYTPVPEPTTAVMLTLGLAGMLARRYRRRSQSS